MYKDPSKAKLVAQAWRDKNRDRYNTSTREYRSANREKTNSQQRASYQRNKDKRRMAKRDWAKRNPEKAFANDLKQYGITVFQFDDMLTAQMGRCGICQVPMAEPHVDHCHSTGRVRGLLCGSCNSGLGMFKDSSARLTSAIAYLTS